MSTTIDAQNALQIREKPMDVFVTFQTGSSAKISSYTPGSAFKSYDSTLGDSSIEMRNIADLAGSGFPLDGTHRLFDPSEPTNSTNGKLGLRGVAAGTATVTISASATLTAVTIATRGVDSIIVSGGTTYPATGLNVIPINAQTATLTLVPEEANGRAEVDYIVPGIILEATNDMLTRCTLALRGNLNVIDHTWEESEIEIEMYYPYDISSSFAYVQNDWPITYQAGFDGDLSPVRKFYLSEPITMQNNLITIRGVDASHLLDEKTLPEQFFNTWPNHNGAHQQIYKLFVNAIASAGITLQREEYWSGGSNGTVTRYPIIPEMTARDFVAGVMNLTLNHTRGATYYGIQFVDAGIPTVEHGDGTTYGSVWRINKSDCGDYQETWERKIAQIKNTNEERRFNETVAKASTKTVLFGNTAYLSVMIGGLYAFARNAEDYTATTKDQEIDLSYDGFYQIQTPTGINTISNTPSHFFGKVKANSSIRDTGAKDSEQIAAIRYEISNPAYVTGLAMLISGGVNSFSNPDGLPGQTIEMEPLVYGAITDQNGETVLNYPSLFNRSSHTISFTWKGDPRMQPLDYIGITDDTKPGALLTWYRITSIELTHDGGGTIATIAAREWTAPAA